MLCGRYITATHRRNTGRVCGHLLSAEAFYYPIAVKPGCRRTHRIQEWLFYNWVCTIINSRKFSNTVSQLLKEDLSMEQQWYGKTWLSIHPKKSSAPGSISYETRSLRRNGIAEQ
jgi:hypothetical protein